jgi:Protein of unknown function (DUF559)
MRRAAHDTPAVFLVDDDGGAGLTRKQTRGAGFVAPSRGVRVRRELADDRAVLAEAALVASRPCAVMTDVSAAVAWGAPTPPWLRERPEKVSVAVPAGSVEPRRAGVRGRRLELPSIHVTTLQGQRITTPGRTWLDCAAQWPLGYVVAMGDWVVHHDLATVDELASLCRWGAGRRGVVQARHALTMIDPMAASPGESLARTVLVTGGVPRPRCNADVLWRGGWIARVDLLWEAEKVVVEYDGIVHLAEDQRRTDAARRNLLQDAGYVVIVFTARDLKHPEAMCATVKGALRRRTSR